MEWILIGITVFVFVCYVALAIWIWVKAIDTFLDNINDEQLND